MSVRRRLSVTEPRRTASESNARQPPRHEKTVELEQRIARLELTVRELTEQLQRERKHRTALHAQLDHCMAKLGR